MFLSKKNAAYFTKPKEKPTNQRVLPGWADDDQQIETRFEPQFTTTQTNNENLLGDENIKIPEITTTQKTKQQPRKTYFDFDQLNDMNNIEFQKKLVENIVEPGGIRIKPNDNLLNEFLKESKSMEVPIVGSLLLSKIQVNYPFQIKAKSLYTIEFLIKKNPLFLTYFKTYSEKLKQFPEPEDNVENYRKILKNVLNVIGVTLESQINDDNGIMFVDPGYNDPKQQSQIRSFIKPDSNKGNKPKNSKKFISPTEAKKKKEEDTFDLLGGQTKQNTNNPGFDDLLLGGMQLQKQQKPKNQINFDDLLKGSVPPPPANKGFDFTL